MRKKFTNYLLATFLLLTLTNLNAQNEILFNVNSPAALSAAYIHGSGFTSTQTADLPVASKWGGIMTFGQVITGDVVVMRDTSSVDSTSQHSCNLALKAGLDVKDKIVLIRRGTCGFSIKAYNAWKFGAKAVILYNHTPNAALIYPGPTRPQADSVTIPVICISRETGEAIRNAIQGGQAVNVTLKIPAAFRPHTNYNYTTPAKETQDTRAYMGLALANSSTTDKYKPFFTAVITEPDGKKVTVKGVGRDTLKANTSDYIQSDSTYKPSKVGDYKVLFTNSITTDSLRDSFRISDFTYAEDRGPINNWRAVDSAGFVKGGFKNDIGHFYYTGINADKATHASFALHNPADFPKNDEFIFVLYPFSKALNDKFNSPTEDITYDDLNGTEVATSIYKIKGTEKPDSLLFVEFPTPVTLKDTATYLLMVRYDGSNAGTGKVPQFSTAGFYRNYFVNTDVLVNYNTAANGLVFFNGWSDGIKYVVRMYMQGFRTSLDNNLPAWAENTVNVFPNPISEGVLNIDFKLEKLNEDVSVTINDVMGRVLKTVKLKNIQNGVQQINISELGSGFYFAKIVGKDGWRTKVFNVAK
jgi:hypothetical protein